MINPRDRRGALAAQNVLNGIDYVEIIGDAETQVRVHFLNKLPAKGSLSGAVVAATISGGETIPIVAVLPFATTDWGTDAGGRPWLDLHVAAPGDFSTYTLRLTTTVPILDPYFDRVAFSFKAGCPSTLDCEPLPLVCAPEPDDTPPIDYLAKDFDSFKKALSDFSALRYPAWQERSEADFGVMFMEALASVADDLSYQQDRIASEAWIETATERRSLVRLARLVDYEPRVATAARTWLAFDFVDGWHGDIPPGLIVNALAPDGTPVVFETGAGLDDTITLPGASVWNRIEAHWWDDADRCLPASATEMWIKDPTRAIAPGRWVVVETAAELDGDPPLRQRVRLLEVDAAITDPLFHDQSVVRIAWGAADALAHARDLAVTTVRANVVAATEGQRHSERFFTSSQAWAPSRGVPRALVRTGANQTRQFLYTLSAARLAWLAQDDPLEAPRPELRVVELSAATRWWWHRNLLEAAPSDAAVTIDPVRYRVVDIDLGVADYDGSDGDTVRFGDGVFGAIPDDDAQFDVTYRVGGGARGTGAADSSDRVYPAHMRAGAIAAVGNRFRARAGRDAEPDDRVREMAPQAFRARQFRAVRAEDYDQAVTTNLPWTQRAGTSFRWTGSWLSVFTAVDPKASEVLPVDRLIELEALLDRYRLAGYEAFPLAPRYASLDVEVTVCARADAFRGDVVRDVTAALHRFFDPDHFTFGLPLERSELEATVQEVPGVDGVVSVGYRRRGYTQGTVPMGDQVQVAPDEIVRVDDDPSRPERGALRIDVTGGK